METHFASCPACGNTIDVTEVGPFTRVSCPECSEEIRVKTEMGPYVIRRRLGVGGMSFVFVAYDETLGREVALKVLNEDYSADQTRVEQFEREAKLMAVVSHPNVVRVYTVGQAFGRYYIAMELVSGSSLDAQMDERGALPEADVIPIALQVVDGLRAAADAGLVHRDVKPGNILLDESGTAKIADFGLSLLTEGESIKASEIWATPYYVSPETLFSQEEDFRSDIYALGSTLYHALSGHPPVEAKDMSTRVLQEQKRRIAPLSKVASWLHPETIEAVNVAMAYSPRHRFESYDRFREALEVARQVVEEEDYGTPIHSKARAARRRRAGSGRPRFWFGLGGVLALLVAVLALVRPPLPDPEKEQPSSGMGGGPVAGLAERPGGSEADVEAINTAYAAARDALRRRDFLAAEGAFVAVAENDGAPPSTAAWARFEAVVAAYLKGRPGDARDHLAKLDLLLEESGQSETDLGRRLRGASEVLSGLPFVPDDRLPRQLVDPMRTTVFFAMALKMWEQGQLERARDHLIKFSESGPWKDTDWVEIYREIGNLYLEDFGRLAEVEREVNLHDAEAIRAKHDELQELYVLLNTRGRARFNVRSWQADLLRALQLSKKAPEEWAMAKERIFRDWRAGNYEETVQVLSAYETRSEDGALQKSAMLALVESAHGVLERLSVLSEPIELAVPAEDREGDSYSVVLRGEPGGLVLEGESNQVVRSWKEMRAGALLDIYLAVAEREVEPVVRERAAEAAAAFALMGSVSSHAELLFARVRDREAPGGFGTWQDLRGLLEGGDEK